MRRFHLLVLISLSMIASVVNSQPMKHPFQWVMPLKDSLQTENLVNEPRHALGPDDRLHSANGQFLNAKGERVKLFGTLLSYGACFPDSAQAIRLARRFRQLGFNAIRMKGWDGYWLLFNNNPNPPYSTTTINPTYLQRLDWFVYQLGLNGIYVFLTGTCFHPTPLDGVPNSDSISYIYSAKVSPYVDRFYLKTNLKFLGQLMKHTNPYTGKAFQDNESIAMLSGTDESTLIAYWRNDYIEGSTNLLSFYHRRMLDTMFSNYLRAKYSSDAALLSAWGYGLPDQTNQFTDPGFEDLFTSPWQSSINTASAQAIYTTSDAEKVEGSRSAVFKINKPGQYPSDIQLTVRGLKIRKGRAYKLSFWSKSTQPNHNIRLYLVRGSNPYTSYGLQSLNTIGTAWAEVSARFIANSDDDDALLIFQLGAAAGDVYFDKASFVEDQQVVLRAGESMNNYSIATTINNAGLSARRVMETVDFLNQVQESYFKNVKSYFRDSLSSKVMIGSMSYVNGLNDIYTQRNSDFSSCESYRGYFRVVPNSTWDNQWSVYNMLNAEDQYGSSVSTMTNSHIRGIPLVITNEFLVYPSPNINELLSFLPMYASYHDADAYFFGDWLATGSQPDFDSTWITNRGVWEIKGQYSLQALAPVVSQVFRRGLIQPGIEPIRLNYNREQRLYPSWQQYNNYLLDPSDQRMAFFRRVEIDSFDAKQQSVLPHVIIPEFNNPGGLDMSNLQTDTKELLWNQRNGWLRVSTPHFMSLTGRLNNSIQTFDGFTVEQTDATSHATIMWLSSDTSSIAASTKSLIVLSSKSHNTGAVSEGDSSLWQGWGRGSSESEGLSMRISMVSDYDSLTIYGLDSSARRNGYVVHATRSSSGRFSFELNQAQSHSLWYQVEQIRVPNAVHDSQGSTAIDVSPQPADESLIVDIGANASSPATVLELLDLRGERRLSIQNPSSTERISTANLESGYYCVRVVGAHSVLNRSVLIHH